MVVKYIHTHRRQKKYTEEVILEDPAFTKGDVTLRFRKKFFTDDPANLWQHSKTDITSTMMITILTIPKYGVLQYL